MNRLYDRPIAAKRTGPLYNAFSYPTKIDPEVIGVFIAAHTVPGDTVLDVFGGSGTTGIAAALCDRPTGRMRHLVQEAGLEVVWGPRTAYVYELSPLGSLVGEVMSRACDPAVFEEAARRVLADASSDVYGWYEASQSDGTPGRIRYVIWSDVLKTPCCAHQLSFYDATVRHEPAVIRSEFICPGCKQFVWVVDCERICETVADPLTGETVTRRYRVPARIYGRTGSKTWAREPTTTDLEVLSRASSPPKDWVPQDEILWGDLHRSGYHQGIGRFHHFYTSRNLAVMARLWALASSEVNLEIRKALQLWVLSYNASHSTLLTRVVAKKSQKDLAVTGAQSGVLYVSGLPVEKNILDGLHRKIKTFAEAFALTAGSSSSVNVICGSSTSLELPDDSVDYIFTDPPFGGYIPYAEINQLNEAWLGRLTDRTQEAIVSPAQNKGASEYSRLMAEVFSEASRVLKPEGRATVIFHASQPEVWNALGDAFQNNGLSIESSSVLDKQQVSFKQVVSEGGTKDDAIFLLAPQNEEAAEMPSPSARDMDHQLDLAISELQHAATGNLEELTPRRMWSRYATSCLQEGLRISIDAPDFYAALDACRNSADQPAVSGVE